MYQRENAIFHKLGYIDIQNIVERIRDEVLMRTGLMETIRLPSTQFVALNKINALKERRSLRALSMKCCLASMTGLIAL